jgi:ABC-type hemin transport system ATPase subunit
MRFEYLVDQLAQCQQEGLEQQEVTELLEEVERQLDLQFQDQREVAELLGAEQRQVQLVKYRLLQEEQYLQLQAVL